MRMYLRICLRCTRGPWWTRRSTLWRTEWAKWCCGSVLSRVVLVRVEIVVVGDVAVVGAVWMLGEWRSSARLRRKEREWQKKVKFDWVMDWIFFLFEGLQWVLTDLITFVPASMQYQMINQVVCLNHQRAVKLCSYLCCVRTCEYGELKKKRCGG